MPANEAIGGYFASEQESGNGLGLLRDATGYQSARSAIAAFLHVVEARTVWVPHFICSAVIDALRYTGVQTRRYPLSESRGVPTDLPMDSLDWLICVDYFGLAAHACDAAIALYGGDRILVDASQALFHTPRPGVATVYSPRKFLGVPDGGLLITSRSLPRPAMADESGSASRSQHLLSRASGDVAAGYVQFQQAEASLQDCTPRAMSRRTTEMLATMNIERICRQRIDNYLQLAGDLRQYGFTIPDLPTDAVPLCCPVFDVDAAFLRRELASRKIFVPKYWPDTVVPDDDPVGLGLRDSTLYLPCDQRYGVDDMQRVLRSLLEMRDAL